jgi:hypothetical protein
MRNEKEGGANLNYEMKKKKIFGELWQLHFTTFSLYHFQSLTTPKYLEWR